MDAIPGGLKEGLLFLTGSGCLALTGLVIYLYIRAIKAEESSHEWEFKYLEQKSENLGLVARMEAQGKSPDEHRVIINELVDELLPRRKTPRKDS
jgi:hypothetical protein